MHTFTKILITNRGEIAVRIIKTARKMNIATVAICTGDEKDSLYARSADECYELKGSTISETWLNTEQIIAIAKKSGADAIHPGYGFLSENGSFAKACETAGIIFIGPRSEIITLMGDKVRSREFARQSGIPVITGYSGPAGSLLARARNMNYPLLIKASSGGGGKGLQIVYSGEALASAIEVASREALAYFGNDSVYLEEYIENPRHIEVQLLGDNHGNIIHLYERECSIQRRFQKIIEESPSPSISNEMRTGITDSALKLARAVGYNNAGTIEFLTDSKGNWYFLEMNTRLQVEHPVTESVINIDIVQEQIIIAAGHKLRYSQEQIQSAGHAIECRIYAEDPSAGFLPSPGEMTCYMEPYGSGIRVDSGFDREDTVTGKYDPMISKLITKGKNREEARERMIDSLENYGIHGIRTNIGFLHALLHTGQFINHDFSTVFCEQNMPAIIQKEQELKRNNAWQMAAVGGIIASLRKKENKNNIWEKQGWWRVNKVMKLCFDDRPINLEVISLTPKRFCFTLNSETLLGEYEIEEKKIRINHNGDIHNIFISEIKRGHYHLTFKGAGYLLKRFDVLRKEVFYTGTGDSPVSNGAIFSPMPGRVIKINKHNGEKVKKGEILIIVESMKMENSILATMNGSIENVQVKEGEMIDGASPLVTIKPDITTS
jgi:3-methylcrotonyl-CoA carboxylase alpha subunit